MPTKRSYGAGNFFLSLDGETTALRSVEKGNIRGEVAVVSGASGRWQNSLPYIARVKTRLTTRQCEPT